MSALAARAHAESFGLRVGQVIFVIFYAFVCWFPRLDRHLRFEDVLTPVVATAALLLLTRRTWRIARLPIAAGLFSTIVTMALVATEYLPLQALLILAKELQYVFIYVLALEVLQGQFIASRRLRIFLWLAIGFGAAYSVFGSFFAVKTGQYGLGYVNELDSPSLSALMYFNLFVLALILLSVKHDAREGKRRLLAGCAVLLFFATLVVGSRTAVMAIVVFSGSYLLLGFSRYRRLIVLAMLAALPGVLWFAMNVRVERLYDYFYNFESELFVLQAAVNRAATLLILDRTLEGSRYGSWTLIFTSFLDSNLATMLFGCGRGCSHLGNAEFSAGLGGDNQYTVNLVELGFVGFILSVVAVVSAYPHIARRWRPLYIAYVLAYFAWGMTAEVWQLSKGGQLFWLVNALLVGLSAAHGGGAGLRLPRRRVSRAPSEGFPAPA